MDHAGASAQQLRLIWRLPAGRSADGPLTLVVGNGGDGDLEIARLQVTSPGAGATAELL